MDVILESKKDKFSLIEFFKKDARHLQILLQLSFLFYGVIQFNWYQNISTYSVLVWSCLLVQAVAIYFTSKNYQGLKSAFISALSLCLLLKANSIGIYVLAAALSILSKFIIKYRGKHIFNPTNFGIIVTIILTNNAWVSPGQWGTDFNLMLLLLIGGVSVLFNVGRLDISIAFLSAFGLFNFFKVVIYYGWEIDVFLHSMSSGTLLLFTFFMITDPRSNPNLPKARIIWGILIAALSFVLTSWFYLYTAPLWALFFLSPFTIFFDKKFKGEYFQWNNQLMI